MYAKLKVCFRTKCAWQQYSVLNVQHLWLHTVEYMCTGLGLTNKPEFVQIKENLGIPTTRPTFQKDKTHYNAGQECIYCKCRMQELPVSTITQSKTWHHVAVCLHLSKHFRAPLIGFVVMFCSCRHCIKWSLVVSCSKSIPIAFHLPKQSWMQWQIVHNLSSLPGMAHRLVLGHHQQSDTHTYT